MQLGTRLLWHGLQAAAPLRRQSSGCGASARGRHRVRYTDYRPDRLQIALRRAALPQAQSPGLKMRCNGDVASTGFRKSLLQSTAGGSGYWACNGPSWGSSWTNEDGCRHASLVAGSGLIARARKAPMRRGLSAVASFWRSASADRSLVGDHIFGYGRRAMIRAEATGQLQGSPLGPPCMGEI